MLSCCISGAWASRAISVKVRKTHINSLSHFCSSNRCQTSKRFLFLRTRRVCSSFLSILRFIFAPISFPVFCFFFVCFVLLCLFRLFTPPGFGFTTLFSFVFQFCLHAKHFGFCFGRSTFFFVSNSGCVASHVPPSFPCVFYWFFQFHLLTEILISRTALLVMKIDKLAFLTTKIVTQRLSFDFFLQKFVLFQSAHALCTNGAIHLLLRRALR